MLRPIGLLCGASAKTSKGGPDVRLTPGTYSIEVYGRIDSELGVYLDGEYLFQADTGVTVKIAQDQNVRIDFTERGTEDLITILAKKVA